MSRPIRCSISKSNDVANSSSLGLSLPQSPLLAPPITLQINTPLLPPSYIRSIVTTSSSSTQSTQIVTPIGQGPKNQDIS